MELILNEILEKISHFHLNILFILGGAFVGLDKVIGDRTGKKGMGFGAEVGNKKEEECVMWALDSFYEWPLKDRGYPVRVDIGVVYNLSKLKVVEHRYVGRESEIKRDGFVFKHPQKKNDAILGIIKIL